MVLANYRLLPALRRRFHSQCAGALPWLEGLRLPGEEMDI